MKFTPEDNILSNKAKKNKKEAELKPYFNNTNDILGLYKNPSLKSEEEEEEEEKKEGLKGMALLKKIYGGGSGVSLPNEKEIIASKKAELERKIPPKVLKLFEDSKNGLLDAFEWNRRYRELNENEKKIYRKLNEEDFKKSADALGGSNPCWKGYEQFGMKKKNKKLVPNCIPSSINVLTEKSGGCNGVPCSSCLTPVNKLNKSDHLYKVSNPKEVERRAKLIYGKDAVIYKSTNPKKKYQILNENTGKWVRFGDAKMEDYTKHRDNTRKLSYLRRASNIKGNWIDNTYSPNFLSIVLLWGYPN